MNNNLEQVKLGLNSENRNFIVGTIVAALLLFGPVEPYGRVIRIAYLIIIPLVVWLILRYWGNSWKMNALANHKLYKVLIASLAVALLTNAILSFTAPYHSICTQSVSSGGETECVGDYTSTDGPDVANGLINLAFAGIPTYLFFTKKVKKKEDANI